MIDLLLLAVAFAVILIGAELFTNGIEWVGHRLGLAEGAVGSVLAAVGTALPETMIPLVAITSGGHAATSDAIAVGAILGAPFMLATLALFVTGVAVIGAAGRRAFGATMDLHAGVVAKDVRYFGLTYAIAIAVAFVPLDIGWARPAVAIVLLGLYALYVRAHLAADREGEAQLNALRFHPLDGARHRADPTTPRLRIILVQVVVALAGIVGGAVVFVQAVEHISTAVGIAPLILALVIAPIATELPEKANSVLWVAQGKDTLAIGNITGAMVFQACVPTVVALVLAPEAWAVSATSGTALPFASAAIAFASTALIFLPLARGGTLSGRRLLIGGFFYTAYLLLVGASVAGLI